MAYLCSTGTSWHPTLHMVDKHHHPPLSWRREMVAADPTVDQSWWTVLPLCGLCHSEYHTLLNDYVRRGEPPPWEVRRTYGYYVRDLVWQTWEHRVAKRPYTYVHPAVA